MPFIIILFGFSVRLYMALNAMTISDDGVGYLGVAQRFSLSGFSSGLHAVFPPFYPLTISLAHYAIDDLELAGRVISFIFSTLAIAVGYYMGRFIYDERAGLLTAFFIAIHPGMIRYSGEILTEGLYYFIASLLVFFALKAVTERSIVKMLFAGLLATIAYLTRPEGIGFLAIISLWIIFYNVRSIREDLRERAALLVSVWTACILLAIPYLLFVIKSTGALSISGKMSFDAFFSRMMTLPTNFENITLSLKNIVLAFSATFFVFFAVGFLKRMKNGFTMPEYGVVTVLLSYWLLYIVVLPERRYFVELMPLALLFSSAGFIYFYDTLKVKLGEKVVPVAVVFLLAVAVINVYKGTKIKMHHVVEKEAGKWLRENVGKGSTIMTRPPMVEGELPVMVFYAAGKHVRLKKGRLEDVIEFGKERGVEYMAGYVSDFREKIVDFDAEKRNLTHIKSFEDKKDGVFLIYRLNRS